VGDLVRSGICRKARPPRLLYALGVRSHLTLAATFLAVALLARHAGAEGAGAPTAPAAGVTRAQALRLGATQGPGVEVATAPRGAAREAGERATAFPRPPTLQLTAGYRSGSLTPGAELGAQVMQELSLHGLGAARRDAAGALAHVIEADTERARLDAAARAAYAWIGALEAHEVLRLRTDALGQSEAILATTRARVQSGVGLPFELAMARGDVGAARASMLDAEGVQVEALAELRFALGLSPTLAIAADGDLYASDERPVDEAVAVRAAEEKHPALRLAGARARLAKEEVRLTAATLAPGIGLGGAYLREGTGDQIITGVVSFPIPLVNPAAYEAARQRANEDVANAQIARTRAEVQRDVRLALHDREHWREVRGALREQALEPMKEALRLARVQYEVGTHDVSTVLLARQRLVATEEQLARVAAEVQRADVRLARATGALLVGGAS
jgi:outer membrane protein TolC